MGLAETIELKDLATYRSYFEGITTTATFLDFFAYTEEDFEKQSSNPARGGWCMILLPCESDIRDNQADQVMGYVRGHFIISKKKTGETKWWTIEEEAEKYARKIVGKIRRDKRAGKLITHLENFSIQSIDPSMVAELYGVIVGFNFQQPLNESMKYIESDWTTP